MRESRIGQEAGRTDFPKFTTNGNVGTLLQMASKTRQAETSVDSARDIARAILKRRKARRLHLPVPLFSEYGWDMLLQLFADEPETSTHKVTKLAEQVNAPISTAVRWLDYLEQRQLIERRESDLDRREVLISLTNNGRQALVSYCGTLVA
jgi:hypothetical protein